MTSSGRRKEDYKHRNMYIYAQRDPMTYSNLFIDIFINFGYSQWMFYWSEEAL